MSPALDRSIDRLIEIMAQLRTPETGCAWDLAQTFASVAPYTIEEAYEVIDAIAREDFHDLRDELGDLLLQVVFQSRIAQEQGAFDFGDVVAAINAKLVRRHPHIFGDAAASNPGEVKTLWDQIKAQEKAARRLERSSQAAPAPSALDDAPAGLPPLSRAARLQRSAATVGFDWPEVTPVIAKVREELAEIEALLAEPNSPTDAKSEEIGDLLFAVVNLARHLGVEPNAAMTAANLKFTRRFRAVEARLAADGRTPTHVSLAQMDAHWDAVKRAERFQTAPADGNS